MPIETRLGLAPHRERSLEVSIGDYSYGTPLLIYDEGDTQASIAIGRFCSFAEGVKIFIGRHVRHYYDFLSTYPIGMVFGAPRHIDPSVTDSDFLGVNIGSDVWIGRDATVMAGVRIGHGAVIGASSLVTKDVTPYMIVGGVPARPIKQRFSESQIERLLAIEWWNWPEDRLRKNVDLFYRADIDTVIRELEAAPASPLAGSQSHKDL
jgi:acetyltransferase-like isoleucine patch superfamily enzyme